MDTATKAHMKQLNDLSADVATLSLAMYRAKNAAKDATEAWSKALAKLDGAVGEGPEHLPMYDGDKTGA